jgi:hypothetical protein
MRALPDTYRAVVFPREREDRTTREVAHVVGTSEANVEQRLHRARVLLRAGLEGGESATSLRHAANACRAAGLCQLPEDERARARQRIADLLASAER